MLPSVLYVAVQLYLLIFLFDVENDVDRIVSDPQFTYYFVI